MKTGKKAKEFEGRSVYDRMTAVFFDANPVEDLNEIVHGDFMGYGTAAHEFFNAKKALMEMARTQSDQLRNSNIEFNRKLVHERSLADGASYLIVEEFDFHDIDNGHHYCMRLSTILEKTDDKWLVTHMHGSTPDSNIAEEEALPMEGLRRKNRELEKKIKEGIREAELEAALERIRARTMGMQKSTELKDVVKVIFDQLAQLNINAEHAGIVVDYEFGKDWHFWVAEKQDIPAKITVPYLDLVWDKQFTEAKKEGNPFFTSQLNFDEKNSFYNQLLPHIEGLTEEAKDFYLSCPGLAISTVIEKDIGLYIENFSGTPYSDGENDILKRFGKVFQQAYTRFLDLKKAEAQTREAQIETALERIRSSSLAMHKTDDLRDVVSVLFEQMQELSVDMGFASVSIFIFEEWSRDFVQWLPLPDGAASLHVPYIDHPISSDLFDALESGADYFEKVYTAEEKNAWLEKGFENTDYKNLPKEFKSSLLESPGYAMSISLAKHSGICIPSFEGELPSPENVAILKRVGKVFEQAYVRFLDLQKAEAQAREAEIQLALERVRARAMAMKKSDELSDVIALISEQMDTLQIPVDDGVALITFDEDSKDLNEWMANEGFETATNFHLPYFDHPVLSNLWEAKDQGQKELIQRYTAEESRSFLNHIFQYTDFSHTPEPVKEYCLAAETYATSIAFRNNTAIFINDYSGVSLSDSEMAILHRFAKEFDQTYTRFLDLQKAEAQAREAEVNLAVERVRAKALAMFKSEEILQVVIKLRNEILGLNIPSVTAATIHLKEPNGMYRAWDLTSIHNEEGQELEISLDITYRMEDTHPDFFMREVWAKTDDYFVVIQERDRYKHTTQWLRDNSYSTEAQEFEDFVESSQIERGYHPTVPLNNGRMCIDLLEPPDPEVESILKKMAGAFDLAYKRFEDLQKAEAQAREAQIEGSLEKVRAQTMGMQASEDLSKVASVMFDQMKRLGGELFSFGIVLCDKNKDTVEQWHSLGNEGMIAPFSVPVDLDYIHRYRYDQWKAGEELFSIEIPENYITKHFELMFKLPSVKAAMDEGGRTGH